MPLFLFQNGPAVTTAAPVPVATGAVIKTMLQLSTPSTTECKIVAWGYSFDGSAAATPGKVELFACTGAATVTAYVAADIAKWSNPNGAASALTLGTSNSGYTATVEGTVANYRLLDPELSAPTNQYVREFSLGREPLIAVSTFVRIRMTFGTTVNAYCWILTEE